MFNATSIPDADTTGFLTTVFELDAFAAAVSALASPDFDAVTRHVVDFAASLAFGSCVFGSAVFEFTDIEPTGFNPVGALSESFGAASDGT